MGDGGGQATMTVVGERASVHCTLPCTIVLYMFMFPACSIWVGSTPVLDPDTVNPQCFAKAGKKEPNHLLNGFGPLQPAVAML